MRVFFVIVFLLAAVNAYSFSFGGLGFMSSHGNQYNWYVDSVNGSDSNSGKTRSQAYQTISALNGKVLLGQRVALAKGSHWREQLSITADYVTVSTYGTGPKPLLDPTDIISAGAWTKTGGYTNIYQATVPIVTGSAFVRVWQDDLRYPRTSTLAECDTAPGTMYVANDTTANTVIYIHPTGDTNPSSDGKKYEYARRYHGFFSAGAYTTVIGIKSWRNIHNDGSIKLGRYSTGIDLQADDGTKHNLYIGLGSSLIGCTTYDAYFPAGGTLFILYDNPITGAEETAFRNCSARMPTFSPTHAAFYGHGPEMKWAKVTLENCYAENCVEACTFGSTELIHIIGGSFVDCAQIVNATSSVLIESGLSVTWTTTTPTNIIRLPDANATGKNLTIRDISIIAPSNFTGVFIQCSAAGSTGLLVDVQRSTFIATNSSANFMYSSVDSQSFISKYNNINIGGYFYTSWTPNTMFSSDYNTFTGSMTGNKIMLNGVNTTYATWKASGQDSHSTP